MNVNKSLLAVLSMFLILLLFVSSASAADTNATDVLSVDKSVNLENNNNTLALDAASNDNNAVENDEILQNPNSNDVSADTTDVDTWYVNASAPSGGNGSEEKPFNTLNDALNVAQDGNTIMITSGEYKGNNNTNLTINKNLNFINMGTVKQYLMHKD